MSEQPRVFQYSAGALDSADAYSKTGEIPVHSYHPERKSRPLFESWASAWRSVAVLVVIGCQVAAVLKLYGIT